MSDQDPGQPPSPAPYPGTPGAGQSGGSAPPPWQPSGGWPPPSPQQWSPPAYAYSPRSALPRFPHEEPRAYHQMLRTWNYKWWKPALGILVTGFAMVILSPVVLLPVLALGVAVEHTPGSFADNFRKAATLQTVDPAALLYLNLVLGSMILVTWFVMRIIHRMRPRWLASVMPKLRWKFLFACMGLAVIALLAELVVGDLVPGDADGVSGHVNSFTATTLAIALVVILTTPLQAAGEEYVFRGYLLQAVGSLFKNKWVAIVASATIFALAHGAQNPPLFFDRFMFGLIAGWLVTRTGGLEAGIAMHILNNFLAFGAALAFGNLTQTLTVSEVSWWNIVVTVTQSGVYAALVLWLAKRMKLQTMTRPPLQGAADEGSQAASTVPSGA
jgi:uncharacterized protein